MITWSILFLILYVFALLPKHTLCNNAFTSSCQPRYGHVTTNLSSDHITFDHQWCRVAVHLCKILPPTKVSSWPCISIATTVESAPLPTWSRKRLTRDRERIHLQSPMWSEEVTPGKCVAQSMADCKARMTGLRLEQLRSLRHGQNRHIFGDWPGRNDLKRRNRIKHH